MILENCWCIHGDFYSNAYPDLSQQRFVWFTLVAHFVLMLSKSYDCSVIVPRHCWRKGLVRTSVTHLNARLQTPRRSLVQSQAGVLSTPWRKGLVRTAVTHLNARLQTPRRSLVQSHDVWTAGYYMWGNGWLCAHKSAHMWIFNKLFVVRCVLTLDMTHTA